MEKYDILIKNCQVLNPDMTVSSTCSVGIKDSWIKKIGPTDELMADSSASEIIDGKGKLVMPGMVDGHTHTCQQLLRGRVADEYPMVWTRFLVPFESNLQPEDSYISGLLACLEMIKSGTTAFADSGGVHMDRVADAVIESGMRAAIAKSTMDMGNAITGAMKETANEAIENTKKLYQKYQDDYGIEEILCGRVRPQIYERIYKAAFDERLSVVNLLLDALQTKCTETAKQKRKTDAWYVFLKEYRRRLDETEDAAECYAALLKEAQDTFLQEKKSGFYTRAESWEKESLLRELGMTIPQTGTADKKAAFAEAKAGFDMAVGALETMETETAKSMECAFDFMEQAFEQKEEMVVFVTELTLGEASAWFLAERTCERYLTYNKQLLVGNRRADLLSELEEHD